MTISSQKNIENGMTLISVMIASALLGLVMIFSMRGVIQQSYFAYSSFDRVQALNFAREALEYYTGYGYLGLCTNFGVSTTVNGWRDVGPANEVAFVQPTTPSDINDAYNRSRFFNPRTPLASSPTGQLEWIRQVRAKQIDLRLAGGLVSGTPLPLLSEAIASPNIANTVPHALRGILLVVTVFYPTPNAAESGLPLKDVTLYNLIPATRNQGKLRSMASNFGLNSAGGVLCDL